MRVLQRGLYNPGLNFISFSAVDERREQAIRILEAWSWNLSVTVAGDKPTLDLARLVFGTVQHVTRCIGGDNMQETHD